MGGRERQGEGSESEGARQVSSEEAVKSANVLLEWFARFQKEEPTCGAICAAGAIIAVVGVVALLVSVGMAFAIRDVIIPVMIVEGVVTLLGVGAIAISLILARSDGPGLSVWPEVFWKSHRQRAELRYFSACHGVADRCLWLDVRVGGRHYPHPLDCDRGVRSEDVRLGLPEDGKRRTWFTVALVSMDPVDDRAVRASYYRRAVIEDDYPGIEEEKWPDGADDLLTAVFMRKPFKTRDVSREPRRVAVTAR